jgi:mRNA-degrading endonuclease RelE of RelBE toxin-antitoxin system
MKYNVKSLAVFERQAKRLIKKYSSLKHELSSLISDLSVTPTLGSPLGHSCYKIRLSIASKGKGKRGGARIITHYVISDQTVYLLAIYDKTEKESVKDSELKALLRDIQE